MADDGTSSYPRIVPYLYYEDGVAALEFLRDVLGFTERTRQLRDDGTLMHGEVELHGGVIMVGTPLDEKGGPMHLGGGKIRSSIMCHVDDVDAHYAVARAKGA